MSKETSCHQVFYGSKEVAERSAKFNKAFLDTTIENYLKAEAPGKRILDIGCGAGIWCYQAARYGAKSVDGFDKQEKMVELAKQATAQFATVNIQLGDIMNMLYDDNTFDVALSLFVTCELPNETLLKHFKEMHWVLAPGGKALVLNLSNPIYQTMYLTNGANEVIVQKKIDEILASIPNHPSQEQISSALEELNEAVVCVCFAYDENDRLFHVKDVNQLINGQAVLLKTYITLFPDFFYDDQFLVDQTVAAGLQIARIENSFTEERRIEHNTLNPAATFSKDVVDHPFHLFYHILKPSWFIHRAR